MLKRERSERFYFLVQYTGRIYVVWLLASMSQHSSTTVYCMNSVVFHFSTVCGILQVFDAVLRYLATFSCGIAVLGPPRSTPRHGFGVSNNGVIFNKTTSSLQSTAKALVLACFFPLRKHSLVTFSFYNASV